MNASIKKLAVGSVIVVILSSVTALAQPSERSADQPITPEQAYSSQGQNVTVQGVASLSDAHGMPPGVFIRLSTTGPGAAFAGYITVEDQGKFPGLGTLKGKMVSISGVVETTNTIPIIRLTSPDQIRIVR